uniref:hypothetical protein n=1 Tax=Streptomyces sp. HSW2009 TaxID=3142890 RepID=UPI0032EF6A67
MVWWRGAARSGGPGRWGRLARGLERYGVAGRARRAGAPPPGPGARRGPPPRRRAPPRRGGGTAAPERAES